MLLCGYYINVRLLVNTCVCLCICMLVYDVCLYAMYLHICLFVVGSTQAASVDNVLVLADYYRDDLCVRSPYVPVSVRILT